MNSTTRKAVARQLRRAAQALLHRCPKRDVVCGSQPEYWCSDCPLKEAHAMAEAVERGDLD